MRFVLYNIRYATGDRWPQFFWSGYLHKTADTFGKIADFLRDLDPDIVGLVEVDAGSFRTNRRNQAQMLAAHLGHYHVFRSKYNEGHIVQRLPVMNKQGNAFVTRDTIQKQTFHYFKKGIKRLVIELELENLVIYLVHLSLSFRTRHGQLHDLYQLVKDTKKPHIVAGDFNARWGDREIELFRAATDLQSASPPGVMTYPSRSPRRQLDFILHSPGIHVDRFWVPQVTLSDHLPLACDFSVKG